MQEMFIGSEVPYGVKYTTYIGNGDIKTKCKVILDISPHGEEITIQENEYEGRVEKRMDTSSWHIKKANKGIGYI